MNPGMPYSESDAGKSLVTMLDAVRMFQVKFRQATANDGPAEMPASLASLRKKLTLEEAAELVVAIDRGELDEQLDACVDLMYVVLGNVVLAGMSDVFVEAFWRVHVANMNKVLVPSRHDSKRDNAWDIVKPEGWQKPDLTDLVRRK